jgi:hypothetical protein
MERTTIYDTILDPKVTKATRGFREFKAMQEPVGTKATKETKAMREPMEPVGTKETKVQDLPLSVGQLEHPMF